MGKVTSLVKAKAKVLELKKDTKALAKKVVFIKDLTRRDGISLLPGWGYTGEDERLLKSVLHEHFPNKEHDLYSNRGAIYDVGCYCKPEDLISVLKKYGLKSDECRVGDSSEVSTLQGTTKKYHHVYVYIDFFDEKREFLVDFWRVLRYEMELLHAQNAAKSWYQGIAARYAKR